MENKNLTAVKWLEQEFIKLEATTGVYGKMYELIEQAKEMEKDIIITANEDSSTNEFGEFLTGEQYYNKMYGNKNDDHTEQHLEMVSSQTEISDDEIEKESKRYGVHGVLFSDGAKWYREQLKQKL